MPQGVRTRSGIVPYSAPKETKHLKVFGFFILYAKTMSNKYSMNINKEQNTCLSLWVIPLIGEMSAKQTKGCPFPEEKLAKSKILTERAVPSTTLFLETSYQA